MLRSMHGMKSKTSIMPSFKKSRIKTPSKRDLPSPLPMRDGVSASRVWLPKSGDYKNATEKYGEWNTILAFLVERFPFISEEIIKERLLKGDIVNQDGKTFDADSPYESETFLFYYREIPNEPAIPFKEKILFKNENIIVVDKPHFLPVTPAGRFVKESLLARLKHHYQQEDISPIHRLDRETAGIVIYTCNPNVRGAYQSLFQERKVHKTYEAIAPIIKGKFPLKYQSRIVKGDPFFVMKEEAGEANAETTIEILETKNNLARYCLYPVTGRQHQLRVHMMALGAPILNDPFYPKVMPDKGEDYSKPLQLLAKSIRFIDPLSGEVKQFISEQTLGFN